MGLRAPPVGLSLHPTTMTYQKLLRAIRDDDLAALQKLLEKGTKPRKDKSADEDDDPPLVVALDAGREAMALALLEAGADPNEPGGTTALVAALRSDDLDREAWVDRLLARGADPSLSSGWGCPLTVAIEQKLPALARKLLAAGAALQPSEGTSPLRAAFEAEDPALARELIERGVDPNGPDPSSDGLPLEMALSARRFDLAEELLARGADPKLANEYSAPLLGAVQSGSVAWVERLVAAGADLARKDHNGHGLLSHAASYGAGPEMLGALLRLGLGEGDARIEAMWGLAVSRDDPAAMTALLEAGPAPSDAALLHVLAVAVVNDHPELVRLLAPRLQDKDACTDPTWRAGAARGRSPNTLLGIAIFESKLALVELLLEAGADPNAALTADGRERSEVVPKGTTALGMAELRKKQLAKAREAHLYPDHEKILALLRARSAQKKPAPAAKNAKAAKVPAGPAHKQQIDAELLRLAREAGGDEGALQAALDALPTSGGPWDYLRRVLAKARDPLFDGDIPSRLGRTLLGRLLSDDPFDGDDPPEVLAKPKAGGKAPAGNVVYLEHYPKAAKKPLREGEIVAASGADVWIVEALDGGDARFSHAHPEGFTVIAEGAVAFVRRQVEKAN